MLIDDAAILTSDKLQADSVLQSFNAFAAPLGLSYHDPRQNSKTWVEVTRRWQSSTNNYSPRPRTSSDRNLILRVGHRPPELTILGFVKIS